ncbi:hypothetical protein Agub_g15122 [Astrephomene gubernaculifera]|uniref:Secondary thiamine-phosphate synthase enzyme n=1 Tax=Astrephomene gubernaculifera TaxID=47775 RepID=A0AAD3E493_9CHLO|nr:hypothetical protein Agub_g15122 [Astrephomene gubernaculifera]
MRTANAVQFQCNSCNMLATNSRPKPTTVLAPRAGDLGVAASIPLRLSRASCPAFNAPNAQRPRGARLNHCTASASLPPGAITTVVVSASTAPPPASPLLYQYYQLEVPQTPPGISLVDFTPQVRQLVEQVGLQEGCVHLLSRHTTTALTINENEARLMDDVRQFLSRLAPAADPYLHNDLHLRPAPSDWPGGWEAWAAQEPRNAHSHLLSMLLGNTLTVPVTRGKLALGTWQSLMLVELDGPRPRTIGVQLTGHSIQIERNAI